MAKYRVVDGKHLNEDGTFARKGEIVDITPEFAKKFSNKFEPVMVPAEEVEETKEAEKPAAAAAAAPKK